MYNIENVTERPLIRVRETCMKKITILTLTLLLALTLLVSVLTALPQKPSSNRMDDFHDGNGLRFELLGSETTSIPAAFYDFTRSDIIKTFSTISFHTRTMEGEFTTLEANWNDPQCTLNLPDGVKPCDMGYTLIVYRTTAQRKGEFFAARSDNPTMGTPGTHVQWSWDPSGDWETMIIENSAWKDASSEVTFEGFRFDPLESNVQIGESIDFKFMAFFTTREEAETFDFDAYKALLAPSETVEPETLPETDAPYDWPAPDYVEIEPSQLDNYEGTLTYEISEDGSTVTISYVINGETVSFTVPNQKNFLFGGYAATDDLGRPLYDSGEVGAYNDDKRQIGLFYFLWHEADNDRGIFDLQKILDELGMAGAANLNNGKYGSMGVSHWFAEPLYGYYYITDEWVLRKHAELLTNAGVDFLFFDTTNGVAYTDRALKLMKILHELNEQGYDAPQIAFYTNTDSAEVVETLYKDIYREKYYEDTWYKLNGKPVIIAPGEIPMERNFTIIRSQWPNEEPRDHAWPWIDFEWPQRVYTSDAGAPFAVNVSIAQHSGTVCFSDSSLKGNHTNRGRSFVNPNNVPSTDPAFDSVLKAAYDAWVADPSLSNQGLNFQAQWDFALSTDAPTILVTSWNEWIAGNWGCFVDTASVEFSRDAEMTRGYYFDNYYMQMAANIQKAKGTAPTVVQDMRKAINVTGEFDQWQDVVVTYSDPSGDAAYRQADGYGGTRYTNYTGRNDILEAKMTADTQNLYVYVKTAEAITKYDDGSSWMQLFVNTDQQTTGWYGYDFIINHKAKDDFTTTVAKYNGTDGAFSFETVGEVSYHVRDNEMMIAVPLEMLGIEGYKEISLEFKWADSETVYDEMEDFYCDGDAAPLGRLNYIYQNYIPGVSQIVYPETETTPAETEVPTEELTEVPTEDLTDAATTEATTDEATDEDSEGCASVMTGSLALTALIALGGTALLRKKKD